MSRQPYPGPGDWRLEVLETESGYEPYAAFVASLDPYRREVLAAAIRTILARQGHNVCGTEWGKTLGKGLYEFRVRRELATICKEAGIDVPTDAPAGGGVLLRVFFAVHGSRVVLLIGGYDKGAHPASRRQQKEIQQARALLKNHQRRTRQRR